MNARRAGRVAVSAAAIAMTVALGGASIAPAVDEAPPMVVPPLRVEPAPE